MLFNVFRNLLSTDLAIDLGSSKMVVFAKEQGIVYLEPSMVAVDKLVAEDQVDLIVTACGTEAEELLEDLGDNRLIVLRPIVEGAISDTDLVRGLLLYSLRKSRKGILRPRVLIGVPSDATQVELRAIEQASDKLPISKLYLIDKGLLAAVGVGLPVFSQQISMVVDIGYGTTEIAVLAASEIIYSRSIRYGGQTLDKAITQYIRRKFNLLIEERTAETLKIGIGAALPHENNETMDCRGRNLIEGIPKTIAVINSDIYEAMSDAISMIVQAVLSTLEKLERDYLDEIKQHGIVLTGGGALLRDMDRRVAIETGMTVSMADDPVLSVAIGGGKLLGDFDFVKRFRAHKRWYENLNYRP
ncbi:MAG: rod shape-determining protein MreB [Acidobacteriota bacterium]|nr:rod shape-determining protein MreB [Acidobacteriota bacterium]